MMETEPRRDSKKFKTWKQVTDPDKLSSLPETAPSANDEKLMYHVYNDGDIIWQNVEGRPGFEDIFMFDREKELCFCSLCNVVVKMGGTIHNVSGHVASEGHRARLRELDNGADVELERRICTVPFPCPASGRRRLRSSRILGSSPSCRARTR
jgi:hypothetical protein